MAPAYPPCGQPHGVTVQDYAILNGETVQGAWIFTGWDITEDFVIEANTTAETPVLRLSTNCVRDIRKAAAV